MHTGTYTARALVEQYRARIEALDQRGPALNHVLELNPDALAIADALDAERRATGARRLSVHSVHEQAIERLGSGLSVEALSSEDGVIEAVAARPCGGDVLAVQWHPEWDVDNSDGSRAFFTLIGRALRGH